MVVEIRGNMGGKKESEHCEVERAEGFEEKMEEAGRRLSKK